MMLPVPNPAFRWTREDWGHALRCRALEPAVQHLFTTRQLQLRPFDSQRDAWASAVRSVGGTLEHLRRIKQVHGRTVHVVRGRDLESAAPPEADAIVSNTPGEVLAVQVADCLPLLLADPRTGAVGAVHAGWRGTAAQIALAAVQALTDEFGADPEDLLAAAGPGIGTCCYEVGPELIDAFRRAGATVEQTDRWFAHASDGSLRLDVWAANRDQLIAAGVAPNHIHIAGLCTQTHAAVFDSYRAAGAAAGRIAALIRVPAASTVDTKY